MASMHYGTPSSLPSDYAILSHYANARANLDTDEHPHDYFHDQNDPSDTEEDVSPSRRAIRRSSFPPPYAQPLRPNLSEPFPSKTLFPVHDEYTPLLVPPIEEEVDPSADPIYPQSTTKVYRDELRILLKYTFPVLRYP
jgi:MATE family multidrug resistance protein